MEPPPFAQVMDDLIKGREFATQLQGLLRDSPKAGLIMDQILHAFSRAIHAATSASERSSDMQSEVTDGASGGGTRRSASAAAGGNRRACRRRTQQSSAVVTKSIKSLDDGQAWRKYGQKEIHNSKHSRAYFRCTHKYDQQCAAQRQVQRCDDDAGMFRVTYIGVHTCRDPAAAAVAPHLLHLTGTTQGLHAGCHLISFAPGSPTAATHGVTTTSTTTHANLVDKDTATGSGGLQGMKPESGDQEEVLSSRTPGSSALHSTAAAATASAWPDQGDVTSTRQYGGAVNFGEYLDDYTSLGDLVSYVLDH